ncbi:DNA starvation/stationary phase protection protein Dps [Anaeromyxobacter sp. PSR-1]|uniref:DNA starvation/stationary phase protection protein Dps n=1 Tax=Anaeromyxobacter sp. PSR-1 TaxID=1300915 RepID=UPI0005E4AB5F|nr:DNA starvation/stationary phase protection protein Dps [Anaeromyxobacter sp. PSR-1]GAO05306.1 DNA protection during starvation protein 2 [Anaeromyxobacter sp. PSR-1]
MTTTTRTQPPATPPARAARRDLYRSPSALPEADRRRIADALVATLADGIDLQTQAKVAHWNVKGPGFAQLHALFEELATALAAHSDDLAERAVTLGGRAAGTAREVAAASRVPELPAGAVRDLELVALLADRIEAYLGGLRAAQALAEEHGDPETVDLLTGVIAGVEKHGWFLRATLGE